MPLAIELVAGRSLHTTPQRMLAQLEQRLDAFVNTDRNIDPRHRTLRDTIAWSIDLLDDDLQRFFAHLSVFHGGWDVEAAADVAREPRAAEFLEALCAWSLVTPERHHPDSTDDVKEDAMDDTGASPSFNPRRYVMLETLREYGADWLRERDGLEAARLRHARYFERLQWDNMATLWGPQQMRWLPRLRRDEANLWAAMDWCSRHIEDPAITTMLTGLGYCYNYFCKYTRRYELARRWTARALAAPPVDGNDYLYRRGLLLHSSAEILCRSPGKDDLRLARVHCEEAVAIYTSLVHQGGEWARLESGELREARGFVAYIRKEQGDSLRAHQDAKAREKYRPPPTDDVVKHALYALAMGEHALVTGDYKTAISQYQEARKLATPDHASIVNIIHGQIYLGEAARLLGEPEIAVAALQDAVAGIEQSGLSYYMPRVRLNQGWLARAAGRPLEALYCFAASLSRAEDESLIRTDLESLLALGGLFVAMGEGEPGVTLLAAGTAGYETAGRVMYTGERGNYERDVALAHQVVDQPQFAAAWQRGLSLPLTQAIIYGLSVIESILQSTPL
jgi:tetratricopeptide (TPR) repeat protein